MRAKPPSVPPAGAPFRWCTGKRNRNLHLSIQSVLIKAAPVLFTAVCLLEFTRFVCVVTAHWGRGEGSRKPADPILLHSWTAFALFGKLSCFVLLDARLAFGHDL